MAERTSTRAGSRRTTPQPASQTARVGTQSPPTKNLRVTRSQSHDISDSEEARTGLRVRKGAKQAIPDTTNGALGQSSPNRRKGKPVNPNHVQQDLSVVVEDPSVVYPNLETAEDRGPGENVEDTGAVQQPTQENDKSPGSLSAFSGTTARISLPAQELIESSPEDMLDTFPDLSDTSEKLLSFVIPAEISEASIATAMAQLQNKKTRENKKLKRLGDTFERQRKEYGGDSYIHVGDTLRRLLGRKAGPMDEHTASWRPDALLQRANLAILVLQMLSIAKEDQQVHFLEGIADIFPQPFAQRLGLSESLTPDCSALAEATFHLALELRTQEAIMLLARHVEKTNFDPDTALLQVFYDGTNLKGWPVSGLHVGDLRQEAKDTILGRVERLRGAFRSYEQSSSNDQTSGIDSLRVNFPWTVFAQQMITWTGQRLTEIEIQTNTHGGAQAICQGLSDVYQSGRLGQSLESDNVDSETDGQELQLHYDTPSESRATSEQQDASAGPTGAGELNLAQFSANSNKARFSAAILKQRQAGRRVTHTSEQRTLPQNHDTASFVQVASTAGPSMRALTPQRIPNEQTVPSPAPANNANRQGQLADQNDDWHLEDDGEDEDDIIVQRTQASLAYRKQQEAESNKENVAEIPESQSTRSAPKRNILLPDPFAKRVPPVDQSDRESDISSDEGFQVQRESSNTARQRLSTSRTKRHAPEPARPARRSPKKVRVQENPDVRILNGRDEVAGDEQEAGLPLSQGYEDYVTVNQTARQKMAVVTKPPQSRSAWTGAETDMLYNLITEHGTSWKLLKAEDLQQGHILEARDQVALKDKARNMKMDYLKAGRVLPPNFERIPLSQLQIRRLRDGGIEYDPETGTRVDAEVIDD